MIANSYEIVLKSRTFIRVLFISFKHITWNEQYASSTERVKNGIFYQK